MARMVDVFIVEDHLQTLEYVTGLVKNNPNLNLLGTASTSNDAIMKLKQCSPELVLMDIALGDGNAFDVLDKFQGTPFQIIFVTGHSEYIQKAFEYYAFYFLAKPFDEEKFRIVIQSYLQKSKHLFDHYRFEFLKNHLSNKETKFLLHVGNDHLSIDLKDVVFCKSEGNYTSFNFLNGEKKLASNALKFYDLLFTKKDFFRVNRFYLINTKNIRSIHKRETIVMCNNDRINVSSRNKEALIQLIKEFNR
ncbi:MAG: LytTR family DNA-binding domain-containing protein [Bacteroidota bacterium]